MGDKNRGYIKYYRCVQDCWIWDVDTPFDERSAWTDMLMSCTHKDTRTKLRGEIVTIQKGQFVTSIRTLSERWNWSKDRVSRFLKLLEGDNMITRECDRSRTLITLVNYSFYQGDTDTDKDTNKDTDKDTDKDTLQETKNVKNVINKQANNIKEKDIPKGISQKKSESDAVDVEATSLTEDVESVTSTQLENRVVQMYHDTCISLPRLVKITGKRKKAISARLKEFSLADIQEVFTNAEKSDFLSGRSKDWQANFDWLMLPNNFAKVLEGNFKNRGSVSQGNSVYDDWMNA